ncbi:ankyrin repeat domain-containing protein 31-like [Cheilinus undulatus]|uniref:ankyrin repeat domain-containing protein 31-like n=1 Tax=Cheilinus undulatus TaxID=241271 RepID=UPI001BD5DB26|nr:ankyrin repeat domain-containing protein 31-like [Cheilinus undulatus]
MTSGCNQQPEMTNEASSDEDSISLLIDHDYLQSRVAAKFLGIKEKDSQAGRESQEDEDETNRSKPPEPETCSMTMSAVRCDKRLTQSVNVQQSQKIPKKTNLSKRDGWGETWLHKACKREDLQMVRELVQAGISINTEDNAGWTALHEAAVRGDKAVVGELLKAGANANARNCDGITPLHDAVMSGHYEVVMLLLQYGSNTLHKTTGGQSALDMADEENIRELLLTWSGGHGMPQEMSAQETQPGCKSLEAWCHKQLCSQSVSPKERSRESDDRDGASEPADIQPREKHTSSENQNDSETVTMLLEEVRKKQSEISTWTLAGPQDADRFLAALTQIQDQLIEVFDKQHLEKDHLTQKSQSVPIFLWQRVMKSRLASLASHQKNLVGLFQKQMLLVEMYEMVRAREQAQPSDHQQRNRDRQKSEQTSTPVFKSSVNQSQRQVTVFRSAAERRSSRPPAPTPSQAKKAPRHSTRAEDDGRRLSELIRRRVLKPGSYLYFSTKGRLHRALVLADGSLKGVRGKLHPSPERWLASVLGHGIPVSSAYAWNKVTFRDKPLSFYDLTTNAHGEDGVQHSGDSSSAADDLTPEEASLKRLLGIQTIRLVEDEELLPSAVMDVYWEKVLSGDWSDSDWDDF